MRLVARPLFFDLSLRGAQQRSNLAFRSGKKTRLLRRAAPFHEPSRHTGNGDEFLSELCGQASQGALLGF